MDFSKLKFACFGDSLTSDEVTGIGTLVCEKLGTKLVGNFAHGNSTCANWQSGGEDITPVDINIPFDFSGPVNCLSNQVYGLLAHTSPKGESVCWTHPVDGRFETEIPGKGHTEDIPDIIYIAFGANDGKSGEGSQSPTPVIDDTESVYLKPYSKLDKLSIASALRWAVETLQSAYPSAMIFVASVMQANSDILHAAFDYPVLIKKREIIEKSCLYSSVHFIDLFGKSGFSRMYAKAEGDDIGIHPREKQRNRIANFIVHEIKKEYYEFDE
mgnify:FL=1